MSGKGRQKTHVPLRDGDLDLRQLRRESERGCILVGAAVLDELLAELVAAHCVSAEAAHDLLGSFEAPLGTFSSRIALAYAMGLISRNERDHLERVRRLRNAAAHFERGKRGFEVGFDSQSTQDSAISFEIGFEVLRTLDARLAPRERARARFEHFVMEMNARLWSRIDSAKRARELPDQPSVVERGVRTFLANERRPGEDVSDALVRLYKEVVGEPPPPWDPDTPEKQ